MQYVRTTRPNTHSSWLLWGFVFLAFACLVLALARRDTHAAPVTGFQPGRIMEDSVFTNKNSMNVSQIQSFLNARVPYCDTNGTKPSEYGGGTRKQYAASKGVSTPFVCLRNFSQGGKSAAQIIYDAAQEFNINPQVLIVLLQKEQGLVTDEWPWPIQYKSATGYGCPDTAPCDSEYYGFTNQVRWAARMFRAIMNNSSTWYTPYKLGNNKIYWHPDLSRCGSSTVNIQNRTTVALYSYTPYRPNQAALNAGYGTGNSCSSYGNRNFYQYFKDWFGSPNKPPLAVGWLNTPSNASPNENVNAWFWLRNDSKQAINLGNIKVVVRSEDNQNFDFPSANNLVIQPGKTYTYSSNRQFTEEGTYTFSIGRYANGAWANPPFAAFGASNNPVIVRDIARKPTIQNALTVSPASTSSHRVGQPITASFVVRNNSAKFPINIGRMKVAVRDSKNRGYDFNSSNELTLSPGQNYTYNISRSFPAAGSYRLWITNHRSGQWSDTYPINATAGHARQLTLNIKDAVTLTQQLTVSPASPRKNQVVTATFTVKNHGASSVNIGRMKVAGRGGKGANYDFPSSPTLTLAPGQTYTYSTSRKLPKVGTYTLWITNHRPSHGWSNTYPGNEVSSYIRSRKVTVR